ncbi:MAG: beta-galactosidase [Actinomycetota bacterium]
MNKKLTNLLGIFLLAVLIFTFIGHALQKQPVGSNSLLSLNVSDLAVGQVNSLNSKRDTLYLNGIWQFVPELSSGSQPPRAGWGEIWVPGDWRQENQSDAPGLAKRGTGPEWEDFNSQELSKAWYQRQIDIPAGWNGRQILIDLGRVSTDAVVYVNGIKCGGVDWPYGAVDITKAVTPGRSATLSILVVAATDEQEKTVIMGPTETYKTKANLASRGLIGEVRLLSFPKGPHVSDLFVQTSTRKGAIALDIELKGVTQAGTAELTALMLDESGKVERQFTTKAQVQARSEQTLKVQWNWSRPRLWDIGQPNLYTLRLRVQGAGIDDEYDQKFGFREFWIEGRKFYLNGTELRLRPMLLEEEWRGWGPGIPEVADRMIDGYFWAGFNIAQLWPWNHDERGRWHFRELFAERADLKGFPLIAAALDATAKSYADNWDKSTGKQAWEPRMVMDLRRYRNHPSILIWGSSPNFFGHSDDQNPRRLGKKKLEGTINQVEDDRMKRLIPVGDNVAATIQKYDPTRPVLLHQGGAAGDIYALNNYLNLIPLQEREEWLSEWSQHGDMPYMAVEFGTPLHTTMMRGRNGFIGSITSEPWMTEFSAIYFGKEAYQLETPAYRQKVRELFVQDQKYQGWNGTRELNFAPAFQKLQQLFSTNTWRSWRTFGISGGMIPWNQGHGWEISDAGRETVGIGKFEPGRRGPYLEKVSKSMWYQYQPQAYTIYPGGQAILKNNGPTLAWIAGAKDEFVAKDHSWEAGQKLQKQVVLLNDTRTKQEFSLNWQVLVGGQKVGDGSKSGTIAPAGTLFLPVEVSLPDRFDRKVDGEVKLTARIGQFNQEDRFAFRVFPKLSKATGTVTVFDPVGKTTAMLKQLGYTVVPWDGAATASLLVIGREAFSANLGKLPGDLEAFVRNGGRAIAFTQNPSWLRKTLGFRVAPHLSRRVFPVGEAHPALGGLDGEDLRDWRGESTLVEAYPDTLMLREHPYKRYGWHWGNRGAVASASVEKPHRSAWRPILESEFDLAYSPLMELDYGKGRLILTTLDLEDHAPLDAGAAKLAQQVIQYAAGAPLSPKATQVIFLGSEEEGKKLDALGVIYQRAQMLDQKAQLAIIGAEVNLSDGELRSFLQGGRKVFFLPRRSASGVLGVSLQEVKEFGGSLKVPQWPEVAGLSASDLRSRSFYKTWLIKSGGEVGAEGLLSRVKVGSGVAIFSQIDPDALNADQKTYFRFTRWRQTRATAQVLANLGASFKGDGNFFKLTPNPDFYHPDYRKDPELGDNPYRYYRW